MSARSSPRSNSPISRTRSAASPNDCRAAAPIRAAASRSEGPELSTIRRAGEPAARPQTSAVNADGGAVETEQVVRGEVDAIHYDGGYPVLEIAGANVMMGDVRSVRLLSVAPAAAPPPEGESAEERRRRVLEEARRKAERTQAEIFASTFTSKWGGYDAEAMDE